MDLDIMEALSVTTKAIAQKIPNEIIVSDDKLYLSKNGQFLSTGVTLPPGDADTLDGKHADEFATASDVDVLKSQVGDKSVADQIDSAMTTEIKKKIGTSIIVDDTSPIEYELDVTVNSKNMLDLFKAYFIDYDITQGYVGNLTIDNDTVRFEKMKDGGYSGPVRIPVFFEKGKYTISFTASSDGVGDMAWAIYDPVNGATPIKAATSIGTQTTKAYTEVFTMTKEGLFDVCLYMGYSAAAGSYVSFERPQLEKGETKTEYTPFVDINGITVSKLVDGVEVQSAAAKPNGEVVGLVSSYPTFELISNITDGAVLINLTYMSNIGVDYYLDQKINISDIADYPIEVGVKDGWTYEKMKSGSVKCWGVFTCDEENYSSIAGDSIYMCSETLTLPFTFTSMPIGNASHTWNYGNWVNVAPLSTEVGTGSYTKIVLMKYQNQSTKLTSNFYNMVYVIGTWK